jgi:hypothetical protein
MENHFAKDNRILDAIYYFRPAASSALYGIWYGCIGIIAPVLSPSSSSLGLHKIWVVDALEGADGALGGFSVDAAKVGCC